MSISKHKNFSHLCTFNLDNWDELSNSGDWEELSEKLSALSCPLKLIPLEDSSFSTIHSTQIGRIGVSQTNYGAAVDIAINETKGAPIIVSTNIRGNSNPMTESGETVTNGLGKSFVFDLSKREHASRLDKDNIQFQFILPPKLLNEVSLSWFGDIQGQSDWQIKTDFGGVETSWYAALRYVAQLLSEPKNQINARQIKHIEETLCVNLLEHWAARSGVNLYAGGYSIVPQVVRVAEEYIVEHAGEAPTLAQIAQAANVSVRSLSLNFKKFRGSTPGQFLREQRLQTARKLLLAADHGQTVQQIAHRLSYTHMGEFAKTYRERFGELPSDTLKHTAYDKHITDRRQSI